MSLIKGLNILSAILGTTGTSCVALASSMMVIAVWMSTREQLTLPVAVNGGKGAASPATLADLDRKTADALYEKYGAEASSICDGGADAYMQSEAKNDLKWADSGSGLFGAKFNKYQEIVSEPGVITLSTDQLTSGNKSGPEARMTFYCRYNTQTQKVLGYEIRQ
jgi:hypothetical protein